jgi:hypothetical protein
MYLDQDDFGVFSQYFPEAWQVFLLVRPSVDGPSTGGFFFWEDGDVNRRSTYRQFPFDVSGLAAGNFPVTSDQPVPVAAPIAKPVPVLVPKPEARAPRRLPLPSLPWLVVPAIAVLFLIAGLFVSETKTPASEPAPAKTKPPMEAVLPDPVTPPISAPTPQEQPPVQQVAATELAPVAQLPVATTPKPKAAKKPPLKMADLPPAPVAHAPAREVEPPPPAMTAPVAKIEPAAILPVHATAAPLIEAEVTVEVPRPGLFKRAFHKIEGTDESNGFVPATPTHRVAPVKPADAGAESRPVDVKVFIDDAGNVSRVQALAKGGDLASAAVNAARQWHFTPARKHEKPVSSEMVLHFRF